MKNNKKAVWLLIFIITIIIIGIGVGVLFFYYNSGYTQSDKFTNNSNTSQSEANTANSSLETEAVLIDNPINFAELQEINPDVHAWLRIPNTVIDYAIAQSSDTDDGFYLDHNIYRNYEFAGTLYTEMQNSRAFTDPNTIVYGHDMLNGSMLQNLHYFEDTKFFNENKDMYIYTPGHVLTYNIFSAYVYDNRHILNSFDFSDKNVFQKYIDSCLNPRSMYANIREGIKINTDDKIVTLSTCVGNDPSSRFLVQGVLVKDELTK